jgi:trigger factor
VAHVPAALKTTVTELPDSRVRLQVEVPSGEVEGRLQQRAQQLGRDLKLPGFRRGKVPAPLVIQRIGREVVLEEAVRETISSWYSAAIDNAGVVPVGDPKLDLGTLPPQGEALQFSVEIGVLPKAELGAYTGLEVARREPVADEERLEGEIAATQERLARLESVERAAEQGDFVVVDYVGSMPGDDGELQPFAGGEGRDQLIELGSGNLIPGFEEGLIGARAEETRDIELTFPADYGNTELAGHAATFALTVKDVKRKQLPPLDDDLAVDAGFDDLEEMRADIRGRLLEADAAAVEAEFRQAALDAAVAEAKVAVTPELAVARAREMWERMLHSLSHRGITREAYLQIMGREEPQILADMEPEAEQALRREAVITAIVEAEKIEPGEADVLDTITPIAAREDVEPEQLIDELRKAGRLEEIREDVAARQAIDLIAEAATPIEPSKAQAREQLWTPEKEAASAATGGEPAAAPARLWTPGDPGSAS